MSPQDDLLDKVRLAWADVLGLDDVADVPLDTSFLEAGGNSLLLVMLWEEISASTGELLKVSDLFQHATVRAQAAFLGGEAVVPVASSGARDRGQLLGRARRVDASADARVQ